MAEGRNASGNGWIGLTPRDAYLTTDVTVSPLLRPWLFLLHRSGFDDRRLAAGGSEDLNPHQAPKQQT